jgi:hypothetical protein
MDQLVILEDGELLYNNELYQIFGERDIIREIKSRRVKWLDTFLLLMNTTLVEC